MLDWDTILDYAPAFLEIGGGIHMTSSRQQKLAPKLVILDFSSSQWRQGASEMQLISS